jgi:hypothetical protein
LPARRVFTAPHDLAHVARAAGAQLRHDGLDLGGDLIDRQACRQVGLQHGQFGGFLVRQVLATGLSERRDRILALLDQLVDDGDDGDVVQGDALVHFLLLARGQQQADGAQTLAVLGAHRGLHVFGDLVLEAHVGLRSWGWG